MNVKYHIVRDAVEGGKIYVEDVHSEEQHVGILPKSLEIWIFYKHARFLLKNGALLRMISTMFDFDLRVCMGECGEILCDRRRY